MTWGIRPGYEHNFIDGRTHVHHIHFLNGVTGGEHEVQLVLGCPSCPTCKRPFARESLNVLNPIEEAQKAMDALEANYKALVDYVNRWKVPVRIGPLANIMLTDSRTLVIGDQQYLEFPVEQKSLGDGQ